MDSPKAAGLAGRLGAATLDELRLLAYVRRVAPGPKSKSVVSTGEMARALGVSVAKLKGLRREAGEKGLVVVEERWSENGAQLANAYRLTRKGRRALAKFEGSERGGAVEAAAVRERREGGGADAPDLAESLAGE